MDNVFNLLQSVSLFITSVIHWFLFSSLINLISDRAKIAVCAPTSLITWFYTIM